MLCKHHYGSQELDSFLNATPSLLLPWSPFYLSQRSSFLLIQNGGGPNRPPLRANQGPVIPHSINKNKLHSAFSLNHRPPYFAATFHSFDPGTSVTKLGWLWKPGTKSFRKSDIKYCQRTMGCSWTKRPGSICSMGDGEYVMETGAQRMDSLPRTHCAFSRRFL